MKEIIKKCSEFKKKNISLRLLGYIETYKRMKAYLPKYEFVSIDDYFKFYNFENEKGIGWIIVFQNIHEYIKIEELLKSRNKAYLINYSPCYFFLNESEREYVVFVGECQLEDIANGFSMAQKRIAVCYIDARFIINDSIRCLVQNLFDMCKMAILNNYPRVKNIIEQFHIDKVKVIKVPFFSFWGMWPQIEQVIEKRNPFNDFSNNHKGLFPIADNNINKSIENGELLDDVINKVNSGYYIKDLNINDFFKKCLRLFDLMTANEDDEIKELFIKLIYKMDVLRDPTHLQAEMVKAIVLFLINKIDENIEIMAEKPDIQIKNPCTEMIVYPHIIDALNLSHLHNKKYTVRCNLNGDVIQLCYEEWIRYYYEYCYFVYKKGRI